MQRKTFGALVYYQFEHLSAHHAELAHGMFTRLGGRSQSPWASLNTGHTVGDDPRAVDANHRLLCDALGFRAQHIASPHQVHSATVGIVDGCDKGRVRPRTDALVTATPGVPVMLRFADCVPILIYDPMRHVVGLAHAGWRGTVANIAGATVQTMVRAFGCRPADMLAGLGPAIGPCCYQVGEEVAQPVSRASVDPACITRLAANGRWHLDLWRANQIQLACAGVQQVEVSGICTSCRNDEWFSHRAEHGRTGRWGALVGLRDG